MGRTEVAPLVIKDIEKRIAKGTAEYGEPLTTNNGRDALLDAYEEALDMALYLRQEMIERASKAPAQLLPGEGPIRIVAAAVRDGAGVIHSLPAPARHHNVLQSMPDFRGRHAAEQGFLTSNGEFADRITALRIAMAAGQVVGRTPSGYNGPELFSEDLW